MIEAMLIGTLFNEEEQQQGSLFAKQPKTKEPKRFHGAFTGGFSAGWRNTCGSKEGF
jgi:G patch domain-containing protein 1